RNFYFFRYTTYYILITINFYINGYIFKYFNFFFRLSKSWCVNIFRRFNFYFNCNKDIRSEEHTSELQSRFDLVCRLLLEKKKKKSRKKKLAKLCDVNQT